MCVVITFTIFNRPSSVLAFHCLTCSCCVMILFKHTKAEHSRTDHWPDLPCFAVAYLLLRFFGEAANDEEGAGAQSDNSHGYEHPGLDTHTLGLGLLFNEVNDFDFLCDSFFNGAEHNNSVLSKIMLISYK